MPGDVVIRGVWLAVTDHWVPPHRRGCIPRNTRICAIITVVGAILSSANLHSQQCFTIEQILSNAFPSGLVAAPSGGSLAWVQNEAGRRNIWVAEVPAYEGR